ncbi:FAD-dependent oxidoreductase [Antribacter gilvus]|uniref:FAD-dependent oxidoreductase n=1 Tax=Antribacter gilvus TaxID=2304675 RepID=UPI000F79B560|nr:FAD-dependent oxidoreductase [Antribacter gilvus]
MTTSVDLVVIGGGPAGCAAAVMATSVGMTVTLVDPGFQLGGALWRIPTIQNVLGGHSTGPDLAKAIIADVDRTHATVIQATAQAIHPSDQDVTVDLADGTMIVGRHAVIATGVRPAQPDDVDWLFAAAGTVLTPLWAADPAYADGATWQVLGADRPLGTFLRAHPDLDVRFEVLYPPADEYKTHEVRDDARVTLTRVERHSLDPDVASRSVDPGKAMIFANLGVMPATIQGTQPADDGYCPPDAQHARIHIGGDLRSARGQRIQTAMGSGAEAALSAYYASRRIT